MPTPETDPKPTDKPMDKPTEKDVQNTPEQNKNVDSDGGERQPSQVSNDKS